jgi:hypothetical protein
VRLAAVAAQMAVRRQRAICSSLATSRNRRMSSAVLKSAGAPHRGRLLGQRARSRQHRATEIERPLAVVMIGLVTSTLLTRLVLPTFYLQVHGWLEQRSREAGEAHG